VKLSTDPINTKQVLKGLGFGRDMMEQT